MAKHHYLPQFYLKAFTNAQGQFMIWTVRQSAFKKNGQYFSPASHFFLPDNNTINNDGVPEDYLEELYSGMESRYARILDKIKAVDQGFGLDQQDAVLLNYFAGELFWRVPSQRDVINATTDIHQLNQLGVAVIDKKTMRPLDPEKFADAVRADPSYFQRLRNVIPATTYWNLLDCKWTATVKTFPGTFPSICGDNPVILRHPENTEPFLDDMIFPLAPNKVLFRIRNMKEVFAPNIKFYIDMLQLMQAREYVCCVDKEYLLWLKEAYRQSFNTIDELRSFIFESLTSN
ncbi:Protein of unknown function [Mucilaginibacter pineti]|uniref:DUF4238 domain-containing protein n=1 Tax=Mucilaginibacter pineti TaxID=1391627 RepID=A0A1G7ELT4_9SPHI|nr:DUF4238 domain-containing protein [Mucilaginibacter pineti]SDE64601.1 Protein of unknown function [Mucilaginibacter pineti]